MSSVTSSIDQASKQVTGQHALLADRWSAKKGGREGGNSTRVSRIGKNGASSFLKKRSFRLSFFLSFFDREIDRKIDR